MRFLRNQEAITIAMFLNTTLDITSSSLVFELFSEVKLKISNDVNLFKGKLPVKGFGSRNLQK